MRRITTHIPARSSSPTAKLRALLTDGARAGACVVLAPIYFALARRAGAPGLQMHLRALRLLAAAASRGGRDARLAALRAAFLPLDSVRYFEFEFAWASAEGAGEVRSYLDLSSPRLFPLTLINARGGVRADLVNPDARDLATTRTFVSALGVESRCSLHQRTADALDLARGAYDLVTSLSVVEHIPAPGDRDATARLWEYVRPGGRFVITVPVAREGFDEYLDVNDYGVLAEDGSGWTFGQRVYDSAAVNATFFSVLGAPKRFEVFGERIPGTLAADRLTKAKGTNSPWREPYTMGTMYARYRSIDDLPGWGVAGMEWVKAPDP